MIKRTEIIQAIEEVLESVTAWDELDDNDPAVAMNWQGGVRKRLSDSIVDSFDSLIQLCELTGDDIAVDARGIVISLDLVRNEFVAWYRAHESVPESVNPGGSSELWQAWRVLLESREEMSNRAPEPIQDLQDQHCSDEIICKIYGFLDADRQPDYRKLQEEKSNPGTHYNEKKWKSPSIVKKEAEIAELWSERKTRKHTPLRGVWGQEAERPKPSETIEELLLQEVPLNIIAKMHRITPEDVQAFALQNGIPLSTKYEGQPRSGEEDSVAEEADKLKKERAELKPNSHPEIEKLEDRVVACVKGGMNVKKVAIALGEDYPDLNWQRCVAIVKAAKEADKLANA